MLELLQFSVGKSKKMVHKAKKGYVILSLAHIKFLQRGDEEAIVKTPVTHNLSIYIYIHTKDITIYIYTRLYIYEIYI